MIGHLRFWLNRLLERLWIKPLLIGLLSIAAVYASEWIGESLLDDLLPRVEEDAAASVLRILTGSMLVIATFAVGSVVTALSSASQNATPRAFSLIISDNTSQNAISVFIGAFIFGVVALGFLENKFFTPPGQSALLITASSVLALVVLTFVRWVDKIARLGRLNTVIERAEQATRASLVRRNVIDARVRDPDESCEGEPIFADRVGYIQHIDLRRVHRVAAESSVRVDIAAMPGEFLGKQDIIAYARADQGTPTASECVYREIRKAFQIGNQRTFDEDGCFGLIVLSEIASRSLSPAINDPGTAIDIVRSLTRVLVARCEPGETRRATSADRLSVPRLTEESVFDDAFSSIERDGAAIVEVCLALIAAYRIIARAGTARTRSAACRTAEVLVQRATDAMAHPSDLERLRSAAAKLSESGSVCSTHPDGPKPDKSDPDDA